ncbi:gliding motility-associated C-terminal domain-containing protein [Chitinophaga sp. CF118]|uniref:gliding motility-associated C-terminal domain-containing protein n=1 Tax=Chitinophaga sp. CF118 TaxID=1884367 RepID=UPI000A4A98F9|nr:gliding motility-associated C-terminal domain-containing protein [Chitinophaga sp. CF118]
MAATPASVGTGVWTIVSGTATIATTNSPTTTVTVLAGNTATLRWTITNGTCVLTDDVVLTNNVNILAAAGPDQNNCANPAFTLAANTPATGSGLWTVVSGTATITDDTNPTSAVTVPTGSTATLRWTITNGTCVTTDDVVLTNYDVPTPSVAGPAQAHCNDALFTMAANTPTVGTGLWTVVSGTATITLATSPTTTVNVPAGNTATLAWTITNGTCPPSQTTIVLTNSQNVIAAAGPDQNNCANPAFTLAGNNPGAGTGLWTVVSGTATITTANSETSAVTVPTGSTATLRWTITDGLCSTTDDVVLTNYATPTPSVAGPAQSQCANDLFTMAANAPTVGTGLWTVVSGTATIATPTSPTTTVTVLAGNTATLAWTISNGTCPASSSTVVLTNYAAPTPITPAPDQEHCNVALFTMAATPASVGTGVWTIVSGTATIATTNSPTTTVTVLAGNTATLRWTITNGTCVLTDDVVLTNNLNIVAAAGPDQNNCANPAFTLAGNSPTPGTGLWTVVSGTATITTTNSATSAVTVPTGSTATLRWTITNGTCVTTDDVVLTNYATPTPSVAGPAQTHCNDALFTMAANAPTVGTGLWTVVSGTATINTATSPTTTVNVPAGNTATLAWTISNGTCPPSQTTVVLTNNALPTTAAAGPDQNHCTTPNFTLAANTPVIGTGQWSLVKGTGTITAPSSPTSGATVAAGDSAYLVWTITNGTCISTDTVILKNYPQAVAANAGPAQEQCGSAIFTLAGNTPNLPTAVGTWTVISPASVTIAATEIHKPNAIVNVPVGVTATLAWTITNGTCSTSSSVTLTNFGPILGNTITADQLLCATQTPAPLLGGAVSGGKGTYTYQWIYSIDSLSYTNVVGATGATYAPGVISQNTWFKRVVTSGGCIPDTSKAIKLSLLTKPPVVVTVPAAITTDCISGKDYGTMFGTPTFSHAPYTNETLTITFVDDSTQVDACTKTIRRTWTATDRCGLTTSAQQTITVVDKTAPVFTTSAPANVTVNCDAVPAAVNLTAKDDCAGLMTVAPTEVRVDQPGACTSNYQLIRTWVVSDACGNQSLTLKQTITVRDLTPPVFTATQPANISVDCDKIPAKTDLTATDNCTPGTITVTPVDSIATIAGACAQNYRIIRKWTATDMCGNTTILRQTITVQDTSRPVFSIPQPANVTVDCDKVPALPTVTATDNCSATVTVTVGQKKEFLSTICSNNYKLTRTWTAKDECGNTNMMSQVIIVQDTTRPVFTVIPPADTTISCDAIPSPSTTLKATDNCSATSNVKISYSQTRQDIAGACASNYKLIRTWTAKDECGNSTVIRQTITVVDTTKPVIDPAPADITVECGGSIQIAATLYARDNCDNTFPKKATMKEDPYTKDVCAGYVIIRRWTIADACGNQAIERVQRITVNPCPKPELDPTLPVNCSNNTKFAILLKNKVSKPKFTLVSIVPATAVTTPLTQTSNVFDLKGATQATFTVTDGVTGCVSDPVTYNLQYTAKPVVNLGNDTAICKGNTLTLDAGTANAAYTIRWSTGETSQTISVAAAGTYTATVTNSGCSTTDSIKVKITNPPVVNIPDANICDGQSVKLNAYVQGASYVWNTGDTGPSITVNTSNMYWVDVTLGGCVASDTVTVTVNPAPNVTLTPDTDICPDETLMLTVDPDGGTVQWLSGETTNSIVVSKPGDYWVTVTRNGCVVNDTVKVGLKSAITVDLGPDRDICTGGRVVLDGTNPDAISYLWNDGTTDPVKEITEPGKYIISVMDKFCSQITMDSVTVSVTGLPTTLLGNDTTWCRGMPLVLTPTMGEATGIRWQDGSISPTYTVTIPGTYSVVVYNSCGTVTDQITIAFKDCDPKPQFPNAFTPNGDGHNDTFKPIVQGPMYDYDLRIYNRWGEMIFISKDSKTGWNGKYQGRLVENGTYVWMLSYKKLMGGSVNVVKGEITVIR